MPYPAHTSSMSAANTVYGSNTTNYNHNDNNHRHRIARDYNQSNNIDNDDEQLQFPPPPVWARPSRWGKPPTVTSL